MVNISRRSCLQAPLGLAAARIPRSDRPGIQLSEILNPGETARWRQARQVGVNHAIVSVNGVLAKVPRTEYLPALQKIKADLASAGLTFAGVESHPVPAEKIKLGLPGRDEEIENYMACVKALAAVNVRMLCYNWMAGLGWYRTNVRLPERGGALTSEFDAKVAEAEGPTQWGEVGEAKLWANLDYFFKAVMPVAAAEGVNMALHPDDPPRRKLRGISRILVSAANFRRVMDLYPSPVNGVTFCQANFVAMGEDIYKLAEEWLAQKKIFFVHFRDIQGNQDYLRETFHDNGPTDMVRMLEIYGNGGFNGPMRPDHAPTLEGEANDRPGYAFNGKIFAFGYMIGIMQAKGIPYS